MIAEFERNQLDGESKLTTEERLEAQNDLLSVIAEDFIEDIMEDVKPTLEMQDLTDDSFYESGLHKIKDNCKKVLIKHLTMGCSYDYTKTYDYNMENFSNSVSEQIKICLQESSRYVANRVIAPSDMIVHTAILKAARKWFLTPEESKELLEKGYWRY